MREKVLGWIFHKRKGFWKRYFDNFGFGLLLRKDGAPRKAGEIFRVALFWVFLLGAFPLSDYLSHQGVFEYAALQANDALLREAAAKLPQRAEHVRFVAITPSDFQTYFRGRRPLPADALENAVCTLVRALPAVLIVDLDTSDATFAAMRLPATKVPIIWARAAHLEPSGLVAEEVLGNRVLPAGHTSGLAANFLSMDWSVREFPRRLDTTARGGAASLHWAATEAYCALNPQPGSCRSVALGESKALEVAAFDRYFQFDTFPLDDFNPRGCPGADSADQRVAGKIVVFGGKYTSMDLHRTTFGDRPGAEIVASGIEHELNPSNVSAMTKWGKYGLKLFLALVVIAVHTALRPVAAMTVTLMGLGSLVWQGVWLAYHFVGYRASVVPFLIGILIEQLAVSAEHAQEHDGGGGHQ